MNGRLLSERLLATTSLAALLLAGTGQQNAYAACVTDPGGNASNGGAISCVVIDNSGTTSLTNTASGVIGPPSVGSTAISISSTGTLSGGITNAGRIIGPSSTTRVAVGIGVDGLVQGGISNSGSVVLNTSTAGFNGVFGIDIGNGLGSPVTSFGGGLSNSGTISVNAQGNGLYFGIFADASTFSGDITNAAGGTITLAKTGGIGAAIAIGVDLFSGSFVNAGTVSAAAPSATAVSIGTGTMTGGVTNSGTISASAVATGGANAQAFVLIADSLGGAIVNSGTIASVATSANSEALALGLNVSGGVFSGGLTNGGTVSANASISGSTNTQFADAVALELNVSNFNGGIVNSGTIAGVATSTQGEAEAHGLSISGGVLSGALNNGGVISASAIVSDISGIADASAVEINTSTFTGNIINSGTIMAAAINVSSTALAFGMSLSSTTFLGGITNNGMVSASATATTGFAIASGIAITVSTFNASVVNSGTISGTANGSQAAFAAGIGFGFVSSANSFTVSTFSGSIANSGTVSASATASGGAATATGISIHVSTFNGSVVNSGGSIAAVASGSSAFARGLGLFDGTYLGGITSTGSIVASATATEGGGFAAATGVMIHGASLGGNISNNGGTIAAFAQVANGTARALGLRVETDTVFAGNIINSGTISATGTLSGGLSGGANVAGIQVTGQGMSGTISNSGTITAAANQGTVLGILATSFMGTIANSGTIAATVVGTRTGVGIGLVSSAATIVNSGTIEGSTWAINLAHAAGANTINQNAESIVGPTSGAGGAILFSAGGDTLNINGGAIIGNIAGSGGVAPTVNIQPGAGKTFSYAGIMSGIGSTNLNSGTLLLQNLTAAGIVTTNYSQSAGSTLALAVTPAATNNHASISASGTISPAPGAVLQAFEGAFAWAPGTYSYGAVVTGGTMVGSFATTSNSPFFVATLTQSSTVDNLTLTMLSPSQVPGLNGNQQSVATAIINIAGGNATLDQLFTLSDPAPALTQLSGSQFTQTNYQPLVQSWQMFTDSLSDRLLQGDGYGGSVSANDVPGMGIQFAQADVPQVAQMSDAGHGGASASMPHRWGLWTRGYGLSSSAPSTATSSPYSESGAGLIIGADNQITDRIVAGIALNVATDKASVSGGGFTQTNAYEGSVYGQYTVDPNWYVNGMAGFGWQNYKTARVVTLLAPGVDNGSFNGQSYRLYGETGYALHPAVVPQARITPYLGLGYLHAHTDGFTENGGAALNVQSMDPNSFTTTLGTRVAATWQIGSTVFRPELRAAWQHEFLDETGTVRAAFATSPGSVFTATGTSFGSDSFLGGAGVTTTITSSTQIFFDYDAKVTGGYTAQAVSGGLLVQF